MKDKIIANIKHLPSTLAGIGVALVAIGNIPAVQQLSGVSPRVAAVVTAIVAVGGALKLIFATGAQAK